MHHESRGLGDLFVDAPTGYASRGASLAQQVLAGGQLRLPPDERTRAAGQLAELRHALERSAIVAVKRHAADGVTLAEAHWRAIRVSAATTGDGLQVRVLADGVATRSLGGDALAGAAAALASLAARFPAAVIEDMRVLAIEVEGRLPFLHPAGVPDDVRRCIEARKPALAGIGCALVTLSDRASRGEYEDRSGALLADIVALHGGQVLHRAILPDEADRLSAEIRSLAPRTDIELIVCTGGTGIGPRDITPETLLALGLKPVPGIGELLRAYSAPIVRSAWLSRAVAGTLGDTLVITLPGSRKAVAECMEALLPLLPHTLRMLRGGSHE